jgi:hypothetical protein
MLDALPQHRLELQGVFGLDDTLAVFVAGHADMSAPDREREPVSTYEGKARSLADWNYIN